MESWKTRVRTYAEALWPELREGAKPEWNEKAFCLSVSVDNLPGKPERWEARASYNGHQETVQEAASLIEVQDLLLDALREALRAKLARDREATRAAERALADG